MYGGIVGFVAVWTISDRAVAVSFCGSDLLGESLTNSVSRLAASYGVFASRHAARKATGIVVKSRNLADALPDDVDRARVRIIPNGVDLDRFTPLDRSSCRRRLNWRNDRFHVLFSTNAGAPDKRPHLAHAAVRELNSLGIGAEFHQLSGVVHEEVPLWLNASDAVLVTSVSEGSPNIVKEALACNVPVVSLDVGDVREQIHGIHGCYIASDNPKDLADKLGAVRKGPSRVSGRPKMEQLSLSVVAQRLRAFYADVSDWYRSDRNGAAFGRL
jgi:glycosyltransferase involved in cell wall biosynthesis